MIHFKIMMLLCPLALSHAECTPYNAIDKVDGPVVTNEMQCGLFGQTQMASTTLVPKPDEEYLKVVCLRQ